MPNNFTIKWSTTVDDIQDKDWIRIYGTDIIKSKQFIKANEEANFKDVTFYNLQVFKKDGEIAANSGSQRKYKDNYKIIIHFRGKPGAFAPGFSL